MKQMIKRGIALCVMLALVATLVLPSFVATALSYSGSSSYMSGPYYQKLTAVNLTGNQRTDVVNIAKSQIGYMESNSSGSLAGTSGGSGNYTEYGRWYGMQDQWCAMFVSWCTATAGVSGDIAYRHAYTPYGVNWYSARGRAYTRATVAAGGYTPQPGDIIYFGTSGVGHVGIVTGYSNGTIYTVEGNTSASGYSSNGGMVAAKSYSVYSSYVLYICSPAYEDNSGPRIPQNPYNLGESFTAWMTNVNAGKNLDYDANNGNNAVINSDNYSDSQKWEFTRLEDGSYKIINAKSGEALDVHEANGSPATNVKTYTYTGSAAQNWFLYEVGGKFALRPKCSEECFLDVQGGNTGDGTNVQIYTYNGSASQLFTIFPAKIANLGDAFTATITGVHSGKNLDYNADDANAAIIRSNTAGNSQFWNFERNNDGSYKILNVQSGEALDVHEAGSGGGVKIKTYTYTGHTAQHWFIHDMNNGKYALRAGCSNGCVIEVAGGQAEDYTGLQTWMFNGSDAQLFTINALPTEKVDLGTNFTAVIKNINANMNLDVDAANSNNVVIKTVSSADSQKWNFIRLSDGGYKIQNVANGEVLDVHAAAVAAGGNIKTYTDTGHIAQKWYIYRVNGNYVLRPACTQTSVMEIEAGGTTSGSNVRTWAYNKTPAQQFAITKVSSSTTTPTTPSSSTTKSTTSTTKSTTKSTTSTTKSTTKSTTSTTKSTTKSTTSTTKSTTKSTTSTTKSTTKPTTSTTKSTTKPTSSTKPTTPTVPGNAISLGDSFTAVIGNGNKNAAVSGTNVAMANKAVNLAQYWKFTRQANGSYEIVNVASGKALDVASASNKAGANVQIWKDNNSVAQRWYIYEANGGYVLRTAVGDTVLAVKSGNVEMATYSGASAQVFTIAKTTPANIGTNFVASINNVKSGKNVAVSGSNVLIDTARIANAQYWRFTRQTDGSYEIKNIYTGKCLDVASSSAARGANVQVWKDNNSIAQRWFIYEVNGKYVLSPNCTLSCVLDVAGGKIAAGTNVQTWTYNASVAQQFTINKTELANVGTNFTATIQSVKAKKNVAVSGSNVQLANASTATAQKWTFVRQSDGSYEIKNVATGKCLDVSSCDTARGANVQVWRDNNSVAQRWYIYAVDGGYVLSSACCPNTVMDIAGGKTAAGTNVQTWTHNNTVAQVFTINK